MANAEVRRQLEERVRASMVGTNVGAEVFHIGSPSDQTGSDFQSVRSRSTHSLSHPTTSPVSFGPIGSPSVSGNPIPEGAVSSPGLMSDVGSAGASFCAGVPPLGSGGRIPTPPGLPLSDPPRVTGAYGVTAYDPDFGLGCRGEGVEPKASIPPPPPPPRDPYVQLLESQSAMSMLMMQMAREMNQRSQQLLPPQQPQQGVSTPQPCQAAGQPGGQAEPARGMRMDEKWIPAMPTPPWKIWHTRGRELSGFKDWLENFCGWLCLIQDAYGPELAEAINANYQIQPTRSPEQTMRSKRLFHLLQQNFVGYSKIENFIRSQISSSGITESNGFELLRLIRMEFSLMSRTEALDYREQCLNFRVRRGLDHLPDIVREVETEIESFHAMLDASVIVGQLGDVRISEGDQFLLYMKNLPSKVQEFLQLHQNATTVNQIKIGIPVLKGAGDNVLPTRGMVDLECKVGQIKVIMRKVVICALDLNVLSSYSLHEQGWETRLGTLKVSGLYHKKVKFPLKISDRAWWLEVLVLKHQGKSSRRKDNGPKDMEVDHVGVVHSNSSSKACHSKDVVTKVAPAEEQEPAVQTSLPTKDGSFIASVSAEENVGYFKNMRRECQVKTFDGLGPFSYVCRMIRVSEPNTKEFEQRVLVDSAFEEHVEGDQHYVHVVNPERVRLKTILKG